MTVSGSAFSYREFTSRNAGFLSAAEQERLRAATVFVCGVGGMGGAAVQVLVRAGIGHLVLADPDRFEVSNLNRQVYSALDVIGRNKVDVTREGALAVNPELRIEAYGAEWTAAADTLLGSRPVVINAMDDVRAGILLYRKAQGHGATVIDAYTSPLPSVTVVRPDDPRPEERLGYPTVGRPLAEIGDAEVAACVEREIVYVLTHSSSARHVDLAVAKEFLAGRMRRPSFAPTVILAGTLMAREAIALVLGHASGCDARGWFFDPSGARVERPRSALAAWLAGLAVRRVLRRLAP